MSKFQIQLANKDVRIGVISIGKICDKNVPENNLKKGL